MSSLAGALVALVLAVAVVIASRRALVIFEIQIDDGKITRARGRIPQALLNDLLVVCPRGHDSKLTVLCRLERGSARLVATGRFGEDTLQRMRNLLGLWPLARLKSSPRIHV